MTAALVLGGLALALVCCRPLRRAVAAIGWAVALLILILRAALWRGCFEKRAACDSKRPKSREETPKEGGGNARRYRTATAYAAPHK